MKLIQTSNGSITEPNAPDDSLIKIPQVIPVTVKRLTTRDGQGTAPKDVRIGDHYLIDRSTLEDSEITLINNKTFHAITVWTIDGTGQRLRHMYMELFLDDFE